MITREIRDTIVQTIQLMPFLLLVPLMYLYSRHVTDQDLGFIWYLSNCFQILVVMITFRLAYGMFTAEYRDNAMEYLLSLPIRRGRALLTKLLPRLVMVLLLLALDALTIRIRLGSEAVLSGQILPFGLIDRTLLLALILLSGLVFGVCGRRSFSLAASLLLMVFACWASTPVISAFRLGGLSMHHALASISPRFWMFSQTSSVALCCLIAGGVLWLAFRPVLRAWDCRPARHRARMMQLRLVLPVLLAAASIVHVHLELVRICGG